jgi:hypothetical protein
MLKHYLHGGDTDIENYKAVYFTTTNAVAVAFGVVTLVACHNTSSRQPWLYLACNLFNSSSTYKLLSLPAL